MEKIESNNLSKPISYKTLIDGLAKNRFQNIVVITGPGIGVPDFQSK